MPDLALRRLLHAKRPGQALCIVDFAGNLAQHLQERNAGNLRKGPLLWCDLGDRRKPVRLLRLERSTGQPCALQALLARLAQFMATTPDAPVLRATTQLAWRLGDGGFLGLAALVHAMGRPELQAGLGLVGVQLAQFDALRQHLRWTLQFPSVWAVCEAGNWVDFKHNLNRGGTVWLEMPATHLEAAEHAALAALVEAALLEWLLSRERPDDSPTPLLVYVQPPAVPLPLLLAESKAHQIGCFSHTEHRALAASALAWQERAADIWVAGPTGTAQANSVLRKVFSKEELQRLSSLAPDEVWQRSGASGRGVVSVARLADAVMPLATSFRLLARRNLRAAPERQMGSAARQLAEVAPQEPTTRHFERMCTPQALLAAWHKVRSHNPHSHGLDGVTIEQFGSRSEAELLRLLDELLSGRYRARALRSVRIPKRDGDFRELRVACVRDRVVQTAFLQEVEPVFEARFSASSFGYRPGRSAQQALSMARAYIRSGKVHAVVADIRRCFDSIDHDVLLRLVADGLAEPAMLGLLRHWLSGDVVAFGQVLSLDLGVPQGESISPLLCNIYLDLLDKVFEREGLHFVRYADDYLVLCDTAAAAEAALGLMREHLGKALHLTLKESKTLTCDLRDGTPFLGFWLSATAVRIPADRVEQALALHEETLMVWLDPTIDAAARARALLRANGLARGFRNYYRVDDAPLIDVQLLGMDEAVSEKLAIWAGAPANARELVDRFTPELSMDAATTAAARLGLYEMPDGFNHAATSELIHGGASTRSSAGAPISDRLLLMDGRLHILGGPCFAKLNQGQLQLVQRRQELLRIPLSDLKLLLLEGKGIALSADLCVELARSAVPVVLAPFSGADLAVIQAAHNPQAQLRSLQVLRRTDPEMLRTGLRMLAAKVGNQASVLRYFARYRKKVDPPCFARLLEAAEALRASAERIETLDTAQINLRAVAMGHEGQAAARYWAALAGLLPDELAFPGRRTRHATDAVNGALNYVYAMLYGEVWRAVVGAGLDPYFAILHGSERDQGSLVFDIIEELRAPLGDRLVLALLGRGLQLLQDAEGMLLPAARRKIVEAFRQQWNRPIRALGRRMTPAAVLEHQVRSLRRCWQGKDSYQAFHFRW